MAEYQKYMFDNFVVEINKDKDIETEILPELEKNESIADCETFDENSSDVVSETNNGDLAGMLNDTALKQYPGLFFSSLEMDEAYPNGESPKDFYRRIQRWFLEFTFNCRDVKGNVLVVTHGGVINVIYHLVKGIEWNNKSCVFKAGNCSIHVLNMDTMEFEVENRMDFLLE